MSCRWLGVCVWLAAIGVQSSMQPAFAQEVLSPDVVQGAIEQNAETAGRAEVASRCPDENQRFQSACPQLWQALLENQLADQLGVDPQTPADATTVTQVQEILRVHRQSHETLKPINQTQLDRILEANYRLAEKKQKGFFEQLADWWNSLFESDETVNAPSESWIKNMLPTETMARFVFYFMAVLFITIACLLGWRELRPFLDETRLKQAKKKAQKQRIAALWPPAVDGLPPASAVAEIYQRLVLIYTQKDQLPNVPGLTHAELQQAYRDPKHEAEFSALTDQASASLFARESVSATQAQDYLKRADLLVRALGPSGQGGAIA